MRKPCIIAALFLLGGTGRAQPNEPPHVSTPVVIYDMTGLASLDLNDPAQRRRYWDETHLVTSLQGLVNRDAPRLFIRYNAKPDDFWWNLMREEGQWLDGTPVATLGTLPELLDEFAGAYKGVVLYDERVPATSNLASTIAGADSLLAVRYDESATSICGEYVLGARHLTVRSRLIADDGGPLFTGTGTIPGTNLLSTGSAKNDAYRWLAETYIRTGRTDPHSMGNYLDAWWLNSWKSAAPQNHTLNNHDYVIANKGVLFDLGMWEDETPVDDRTQTPGTDLETLKILLRACYDQFSGDGMIAIPGFVPWAFKYTDFGSAGGTHGPVASEWRYAEILSCFNAYMDADALGFSSFPNASFYQHYPLPAHIAQNPIPTKEALAERGLIDKDGFIIPKNYYANYQGDYDSAAWLYWKMPDIWTDPQRGVVPMTWPFNPNLAERFPFGMKWLRDTRTTNDFFVAGDSGAGYINPRNLSPPRPFSDLPDGLAAWTEHCKRLYAQWDISATGFIIDGNTAGMTPEQWDAYATFSPNGIVAQRTPDGVGLWKGVPYLRMLIDLPNLDKGEAQRHAEIISRYFEEEGPTFLLFRSVLRKPSLYVETESRLHTLTSYDFQLVDLYTLMALVREYIPRRDEYLPRSPHFAAEEIAASPDDSKGLRPIPVEDGSYRIVDEGGVKAWQLSESGPAYLYFGVSRGFVAGGFGEDRKATLEVTFWTGGGDLVVHYDSAHTGQLSESAYFLAPEEYALDGNPGWRTESFTLDRPRFEGRENGGADLRLATRGGGLRVSKVRLVR